MRVGLTGGIACGKSHVLRGLGRAGFVTLDLDAVAHELTAAGGAAVPAIVEAFGSGMLAVDGGIDRRRLGAVVFGDAAARGRLNGVVHPLVRAEEERRVSAVPGAPPVLVVDGALLVETGGHLRFDRLIVVSCALDVQLERLARRDGLEPGAARQRVAAQMPVDEKRRFASFEIDTAHAPEETDRRVESLGASLWALARGGPSLASARLSEAQVVACLAGGGGLALRGWRVDALLRVAGENGRLDLGELCARFVPEQSEPWYALRAEDGVGGATTPLAAATAAVLFELTCGPRDAPHALAAAASLARLAGRDAAAIASACLIAEALLSVASTGGVPREWRSSFRAWRHEAAKWGSPTLAGAEAAVLDAVAARAVDGAASSVDAGQVTGPARALHATLLGLGDTTRPSGASTAEAQAAARALLSHVRTPWGGAAAPFRDDARP